MAKYLKFAVSGGSNYSGDGLVSADGICGIVKSANVSIDILYEKGASARLTVPTMGAGNNNANSTAITNAIQDALFELRKKGYTEAVATVTMPSGFGVEEINAV